MEIENQQVQKKLRMKKRIIIGSIIFLCTLLVVYLSMALYFVKHFYFGSAINEISVSGKTVEDIESEMLSGSETYILKLEERDKVNEEIKGNEINFKYDMGEKIQDLKNNQSAFGWIYGIFKTSDYKIDKEISYDKIELKKIFNNLDCLNNNIVEPQNAKIEYKDNKYVIEKEVPGNKVNTEILYSNIIEAINNEKAVINLEEIKCYEKPKYSSESKEVVDGQNTLNKYIGVSITYTLGGEKEVFSGKAIHDCLTVGENFEVGIDENKVKEYVNGLSIKYDTLGSTRSFATSLGTTVNVGGGSYGWLIDYDKETQGLISAIKEGKSVERQPIYAQSAMVSGGNDIGNTYVEINLTKQHMWFYKDGVLMVDGPVVTGNADSEHATPSGIYSLNYKEKDAILRGPGYAAPVSYWMPFNGGIGIHDATWRSQFGGEIYIGDGSHGCINAPYNVASIIFENISPGNPIVCYY